MKPDRRLVDVLLKTEQAHRRYEQHNPNGHAWSDWYARYMLDSTNFNQLTNRDWHKADLAEALEDLKVIYEQGSKNHHWAHFFALRLSN